jgi:hypothetical protein
MAHPRPDTGSIQVTVAAAAALMLLAAAFLGAGAGILGQAASACQAQPAPSTAAASIPAAYLTDYQEAGTEYGIAWTVLAGIGEVESDQGRSQPFRLRNSAETASAWTRTPDTCHDHVMSAGAQPGDFGGQGGDVLVSPGDVCACRVASVQVRVTGVLPGWLVGWHSALAGS